MKRGLIRWGKGWRGRGGANEEGPRTGVHGLGRKGAGCGRRGKSGGRLLAVEEGAQAGAEDDFIVDDDEFFIEEHLDGLGEDLAFKLLAFLFDVGSGVFADVDVEDVLEDDGSFVEVFGDEVGGAAGDADALLPGLVVGFRAGEVGQE